MSTDRDSAPAKKVLLISASPPDHYQLETARELRELAASLRGTALIIDPVPAATRDEIRTAIDLSQPAVVHFSAHGGRLEGLLLQDGPGGGAMGVDELADLFRIISSSVQCVFLASCSSDMAAEAIAAHVDYVIAVPGPIEDDQIIEFAKRFYRSLADGEAIEGAFERARHDLEFGPQPPATLPKLYRHRPDDADQDAWIEVPRYVEAWRPSYVERMVEDLEKADRPIADKERQAFVHLVVYLAVRAVFEFRKVQAAYCRRSTGPVDLVVRAAEVAGVDRDVYIHLGGYLRRQSASSASLGLIPLAIREMPAECLILSPFELAPTVLEYASHFLGKEGLFPVTFRHLRLRDLLRPQSQAGSLGPASEKFEVQFWRIIRHDVFYSRLAAESKSGSEQISFDPSAHYCLKVWLAGVDRSDLSQLSLSATEADKPAPRFELVQSHALEGESFLLVFDIELVDQVAAEQTYRLSTPSGLDGKSVDIELPAFRYRRSKNLLFNDFRDQESAAFLAQLQLADPPSLVFVQGEGGIGKTYFCENACRHLRFERGYRTHLVNITSASVEGIFYKLLWPAIAPGREYDSEDENSGDRDILRAILREEIRTIHDRNAARAAEKITDFELESVSLEMLTYLVARILQRSPKRQLILVTNCQELSPYLIAGFRHLFFYLDEMGWGQTTFVLEYRNNREDRNPELETLVGDLVSSIRGRTLSRTLAPLSRQQIQAGLQGIVTGCDESRLATAILRKSSGNPLFIRQLMYYFIERNYIETNDLGSFVSRLTVVDFPGLEIELRQVPDRLEEIISRRVKYYLDEYLSRESSSRVSRCLSVCSLSAQPLSVNRVSGVFGWPETETEQLRGLLIREDFFRSSLSDHRLEFVHEIMRLGVRDTLRQRESFRAAMTSLLETLDGSRVDDRILGGEAHYQLDRLGSSFEWFSAGFELAKGMGSFPKQRTCLIGSRRIVDRQLITTETDARQKLLTYRTLGEVEMHVGSQIEARAIFDSLLNEIETVSSAALLDPRELYSNKLDVIFSKMTLHHRALHPQPGLEALSAGVSISRQPADLQRLANRLVIICYNSSFPRYAERAARIAGAFPALDDAARDTLASNCSNLGNIYLETNPAATDQCWVEGAGLAESRREKTHCALNTLVARLFFPRGTELEKRMGLVELKERIEASGVANQLIRLSIYEGIEMFEQRDVAGAEGLFSYALKKASINNLKFLEWQLHNNLAACRLEMGALPSSISHFEKALQIIGPTVNFRLRSEDSVARATEFLLQRHGELVRGGWLEYQNVLDRGFAPPEFSGSFLVLLLNLKRLLELPEFEDLASRLPFDLADASSLVEGVEQSEASWRQRMRFQWRDRDLYLAIE